MSAAVRAMVGTLGVAAAAASGASSVWARAPALTGPPAAAAKADAFPGIGRPATLAEVRAWDIDVRPDLLGLPPGSGSVAQGQVIWEAQCASCHGIFGESNEVFTPLVGGTTAADLKSGRVARLTDPSFPGRTTFMKLPTLSTLWDYIRRAMPWNAPKSLSDDQVYAVTAYMLNLAGIVPDAHVLSDRNFAATQALIPNRNGMSTRHAMWPARTLGGLAQPDVRGSACMSRCEGAVNVTSSLPEHARDAHGNLAEQNRLVGAQRGAVTVRSAVAGTAAPAAASARLDPGEITTLLARHACGACHGVESKLVGPSLREIAARHAKRSDALAYLGSKIKAGGVGTWGQVPMPPQSLPDEDARRIAQWLVDGARP